MTLIGPSMSVFISLNNIPPDSVVNLVMQLTAEPQRSQLDLIMRITCIYTY